LELFLAGYPLDLIVNHRNGSGEELIVIQMLLEI
jgi:hypothetical protein